MYYGAGNVDRSASGGQLPDAAAYTSGGCYVCTRQMEALLHEMTS